MLKCLHLQCEDQTNPIGIDCPHPKFSFVIHSNQKSVLLKRYHIQISKTSDFTDNVVWDTGVITSDKSVNIPYNGQPLKPHTRYYYRVKIWDNYGNRSDWSEHSFFETAFMHGTTWD